MKIIINLLYWDNGDKQRLANTNLSWYMLQKFSVHAFMNGLSVSPVLWDFSEERVLVDGFHESYPKGEYKRSKKINRVMDNNSYGDHFWGIIDSDVIIKEEDYDAYVYLLKNLKKDKFYVFNLDDVIGVDGVDFEKKEIDYTKIKTSRRAMNPDLGALFFVNCEALKTVGGFDERFTVWGGEDNEMAQRLLKNGYKKVILPVTPLHLPHDHALTEKDMEQYKKQVQILGL